MNSTAAMLSSFLKPNLDPAYILALIGPLLETLSIAVAAMTIVFLLSLPLAIACSLRLRGAAALVNALSLLRAIPDLTLAILCVILFGLGPGAGMIALIIYYTASVSKVFADLLETAPISPLRSLASTGASKIQKTLYGRLPLVREDLFNYGAYAFECALRSSVIVGAVGCGGIGSELVGSIAGFEFSRASTQILMMLLLILLIDRLVLWLRGRPILLLWIAVGGLAAALTFAPRLLALSHAKIVLSSVLPPQLSQAQIANLPHLLLETLLMAIAGTFASAVIASIVGLAAARSFAPPVLVFFARRVLELLRTIPEIVWGLLFVAFLGVGPIAGAMALGIHSLGSFGRIFGDTFDSTPRAPRENLAMTGASNLAVALFAILPLSIRPLRTHILFRFEWNLRMATVLGLIGAGGLGQALYQSQQLFFYRETLAYVLVTAALVLLVDNASARLRRRLSRDDTCDQDSPWPTTACNSHPVGRGLSLQAHSAAANT